MAEIMETATRRKHGARSRRKHHSLKTDMTPMVDLGFLLIAFFVMTSEMSKPKVIKLNVPREDGPPTTVAKSTVLTILLGKDNRVNYYEGDLKSAVTDHRIITSNMSQANGIGNVIIAKQKQLDLHPINNEGREGLMVVIKPGPQAKYKQLINVLDEMEIHSVKKYAVVKQSPEERALGF
jgi:biopolymer transport protein ExbD